MNPNPPILLERPLQSFDQFLGRCGKLGLDTTVVRQIAQETITYLKSTGQGRADLEHQQLLEVRWYTALQHQTIDWEVYETTEYLGELWACWSVYSRGYLRNIAKLGILDNLEPVTSILDLGCGFGYTSAALAQMFPDAEVTGTNIGDSPQTRFAQKASKHYGFKLTGVLPDSGPVDLVFASEYFEHFQNPIKHLQEVLSLKPRALLIANAFGARGIGHFYSYNGSSCRDTSKAFTQTLRASGYAAVPTKLWNNRPTYWRLQE